MKLRSHWLAVLALALLSLPAAAQARGVGSTRSTRSKPVCYGSFERTKLLTRARKHGSDDVMRLGAADRRTLLTTGKSIHKKKTERRFYR